jgi:hypothetical protein
LDDTILAINPRPVINEDDIISILERA